MFRILDLDIRIWPEHDFLFRHYLGGSLVFSFVFAGAGMGIMGLTIAMLFGFLILGILTVRFICVLYNIKVKELFIFYTLFLNIAFISIAMLLKFGLEMKFSGTGLLISGFIVEVVLFLLYCLNLWKLSVNWPAELINRLVTR